MMPDGEMCPYCHSPLVKKGHFLECTKCSYNILHKKSAGESFFESPKPIKSEAKMEEATVRKASEVKAQFRSLKPRMRRIGVFFMAFFILLLVALGPAALLLLLFLPFLVLPLLFFIAALKSAGALEKES